MSGAVEELYGDDDVNDGVVETPTPEAAPAPVVQETPPGQPEPQATPSHAQPQPGPAHDPMAPIAALVDERLKRQTLERELAAYRQREAEANRKRQEQSAQAPHPLDDPEGFVQWQQQQLLAMREEFSGALEERAFASKMAMSRELIEDQLGPEKFGELAKWIDAWPRDMHARASAQAHPYRWAWNEFQKQQKAKRAEEVLSKLGDRSLDDIVADAVAKARAEWEAGGVPPPPPQRARNPDGTFASPQPSQQRHRPESLSKVNGAAVAPTSAPGSALDELYG